MKVVYETIEKTLSKAIHAAAERNRRIEYIELSPSENMELNTSLDALSGLYVSPLGVRTYMGVTLTVRPGK
jgi:hypothetical protein